MKFVLFATYTNHKIMPDNAVPERYESPWRNRDREQRPTAYSIDINSVEDIARLADITRDGVVIYKSDFYDDIAPYTIEIYNGYRE